MELKLYAIPGSHPCATVEAALALKGLAYERADLLPGASAVIQRARFGRRTVPGLVVDGYKVSGSRLILRTLDGLKPEPRLYPADPDRLAAVEEAELWGDDELQTGTRWIVVYAMSRRPEAGDSYLEGSNAPRLPFSAQGTRAIFTAELRILAGGPSATERWLRELPAQLDNVDELIAQGLLGGEEPNAADLQIAGSVRLLLTLDDLRDPIDARPCGQLARRLIPDYPGRIPTGALPAEWIPPLEARAPVPAG